MWCDLTSNEIFEAACKIKCYKKVLRGKPVLFVLFVCVYIFCAYNADYTHHVFFIYATLSMTYLRGCVGLQMHPHPDIKCPFLNVKCPFLPINSF